MLLQELNLFPFEAKAGISLNLIIITRTKTSYLQTCFKSVQLKSEIHFLPFLTSPSEKIMFQGFPEKCRIKVSN